MRTVFEMSLADLGLRSRGLIQNRVLWFTVVICMAGKCLKTPRQQSSSNLQQGNESVTLGPLAAPPPCPCSNLEPHQTHREVSIAFVTIRGEV